MKNAFKIAVLLLICSKTVLSQQEVVITPLKKIQYFCELNGGYLAGAELRGLMHVKNGITIGRHFAISLGVGLETHVPGRYIPLFFESKYILMKRKTSPFISVSGGYLQGIQRNQFGYYGDTKMKGGLTTGARIGIQHFFSGNVGIQTSFGYRYSYAESEGSMYYIHLPYEPMEMSYNMNRFELNVGLIFK